MSSERKSCLIDEMLTELAISRQSMSQQSNIISDIIDRSNNVLLQIESTSGTTNSCRTNTDNSTKQQAYSFKKETMQTLAKIIENSPQMFNPNMQTLAAGLSQNRDQFEKYLEQSHQRAEYLSSCVRKLLAVGDTLTQIKTVVHEDSDGNDNSEELEPSNE